MNNDVTDSAWQQRNSVEQVEQQLLGYFNDWKGTPYRYGGNGRSGIDCSAFVKNAYQSVFKVDVPRTTWLQASLSYQVERTELLPGDLVLFKTSRSVRHIGVVVNGNHFMHVSETVRTSHSQPLTLKMKSLVSISPSFINELTFILHLN